MRTLMRFGFPMLLLMLLIAASGCKKEGCTDPLSDNFDPDAKVDDGSCAYSPATLSLEVTHKVGNQPFAFYSPFQDANGRNYLFRVARFHLSSREILRWRSISRFQERLPRTPWEKSPLANTTDFPLMSVWIRR
jgi:hypothetical protein